MGGRETTIDGMTTDGLADRPTDSSTGSRKTNLEANHEPETHPHPHSGYRLRELSPNGGGRLGGVTQTHVRWSGCIKGTVLDDVGKIFS